MPRRLPRLLLPLLLLTAAGELRPAAAAQTSAEAGLPHLLLLPDEGAPVRYSPGTLDRAAHAQHWLRHLVEIAGHRSGRFVPLQVVVLTREEWESLSPRLPYGLPLVTEGGALALPALGDPGTVELWSAALPGLPPMPGNPIRGTPEEAASLAAADYVAAPAAARELALAVGYAPEEPWVGDLLGHLLALDAAFDEQLGRAEAMLAFWQAIRRAPARPNAGALENELRRHALLAAAAEQILARERWTPGRKLWKLQKRGDGVLRTADLRAEFPEPFAALDKAAGRSQP